MFATPCSYSGPLKFTILRSFIHLTRQTMPRSVNEMLNHRSKPMVKTSEARQVTDAVERYVNGHRSETKAALFRRRQKAWKGTDGPKLIPNILRDIKLVFKNRRERKRRMSKPSALRQLSISYPKLHQKRSRIPVVQLVPQRRHASSGFPYPLWLSSYAITPED